MESGYIIQNIFVYVDPNIPLPNRPDELVSVNTFLSVYQASLLVNIMNGSPFTARQLFAGLEPYKRALYSVRDTIERQYGVKQPKGYLAIACFDTPPTSDGPTGRLLALVTELEITVYPLP
jgi:hypothetical protein